MAKTKTEADAPTTEAALATLRILYLTVTGEEADEIWDEDMLHARIAAFAQRPAPPAPPAPTGQPEERVRAIVMVDHVYLPLDSESNVRDDWRDVPGRIDYDRNLLPNEKMDLARQLDTKQVRRGTRLTMPKSCADLLHARGLAEVI